MIAIAGSLSKDATAVYLGGIDAIFSIMARISTREDALADAAENLRLAARNIAAAIRIGGSLWGIETRSDPQRFSLRP